MKPKDPPTIQLSYMELSRLSGYEIPSRPCYVVFNRVTREIAKVVSSNKVGAVMYLDWNIYDCDIEYVGLERATFGVKYCKPLRLRKDLLFNRK